MTVRGRCNAGASCRRRPVALKCPGHRDHRQRSRLGGDLSNPAPSGRLDRVLGLVGQVPAAAVCNPAPLDHSPSVDEATALSAPHFHGVRCFHEPAAVYRLACGPDALPRRTMLCLRGRTSCLTTAAELEVAAGNCVLESHHTAPRHPLRPCNRLSGVPSSEKTGPEEDRE